MNCDHVRVRPQRIGRATGIFCVLCNARVDRKGNKYAAKRTRGYASKREAERADVLKWEQSQGLISDLQEQVRFELTPEMDGERASAYIADFSYIRDGKLVIEDVKGMRTALYKLKRKMMLYRYNIRITEI